RTRRVKAWHVRVEKVKPFFVGIGAATIVEIRALGVVIAFGIGLPVVDQGAGDRIAGGRHDIPIYDQAGPADYGAVRSASPVERALNIRPRGGAGGLRLKKLLGIEQVQATQTQRVRHEHTPRKTVLLCHNITSLKEG